MDQTFTITLTKAHLDIIGAGLGELQAKFAMPVLMEINRQISEAIQPKPEEKTE
jgi:hypothetical protein